MGYITDKVIEAQIKSQMKKRKEIYEKYFDTLEPTEFQKEILAKWEMMKDLFIKYPIVIDSWHDVTMKCFELAGKGYIEVNGNILYKKKEHEEYVRIKKEIEFVTESLKILNKNTVGN